MYTSTLFNHTTALVDIRNFSSTNEVSNEYEFDIKASLVGQKAKTDEELYALYKRHANALGFCTKKTTVHQSQKDGRVIDKYFTCSCQGKPQPRKKISHVTPTQVDELVHPSPYTNN